MILILLNILGLKILLTNNMNKKKLINHLKNDIYCRIGVSKIAGVGVIAIKDIPKNTNPFKTLNPHNDKILELQDKDLKDINKNVKSMIKDFFGSNKKKTYDVLYYGLNFINISFYLNHSSKPNINLVDTKDNEYLEFRTNRKIKKGEELTIDYEKYQ